MIKLKSLLKEIENTQIGKPLQLKAQYMSSDGYEKWETFSGPTALEDLRKWIIDLVGRGEVSDSYNYIVSNDGVGRIHVQGLKQGELRKIVYPEKYKFEEPEIDYIGKLAETALKLNFPKLFKLSKKEFPYYGSGREFQLTYDSPDKKQWSFMFDSIFSKETGMVNITLNLFYLDKNFKGMYPSIIRPIDSVKKSFKPSGNRDLDLNQLESILIQEKQKLEEFINLIQKK